MKRLADALYSKAILTADEREAIEEVQTMAIHYSVLTGFARHDFREVVRTSTSGQQRWFATRHTPPEHTAFKPLMALLDDLLQDQGLIKTEAGWFNPDDFGAAGGKIVREDGKEVIVFPYLHPWKVKPDKETGRDGQRGEPIYRRPDQRGPDLTTFRVTPLTPAITTPAKKEWWQRRPQKED
jgi:hypothetical protein